MTSPIKGTAWRCHARPASRGGQTCGHLNMPGESIKAHDGNECCAECGCTRIAGTDRYKRSKAVQCRMWIVTYMARATLSEPRHPVKITVIADSTDDAYHEARTELSEGYLLGHPVSAEPVVTP